MNCCSNIERNTEIPTLVFDLYRQYGHNDYIGENVSQLQHAIQCGVQAMNEYPDRPDYILGAFLHDIGHLIALDDGRTVSFKFVNSSMDGLGLCNHENIGADFLEKLGFPKSLTDLGRNHVLAKRYLISINPEYHNSLSDASKKTFLKQGGKLTDDEMTAFKKTPDYGISILMRIWDDQAKLTDYDYKYGIDFFEDMAIQYLEQINDPPCKNIFK